MVLVPVIKGDECASARGNKGKEQREGTKGRNMRTGDDPKGPPKGHHIL